MFGLEIVAMNVGVGTYIGNMLVIHNISKQESNLMKKCNAIAYHAIHQSVLMKESLTEHIRSENNPADLLTKVITRQKRKHLVSTRQTCSMT